jgi:hypothetical protein
VSIPGLQDWLLSLNFSWAQELCIIMFVWMAKFGAAYGVRTGIHVGVDVLINRLGDSTAASSSSSVCSPAHVYRHRRHAGCALCLGKRRALRHFQHAWAGLVTTRRPDHARPGMADLDRLQRDSARQQR